MESYFNLKENQTFVNPEDLQKDVHYTVYEPRYNSSSECINWIFIVAGVITHTSLCNDLSKEVCETCIKVRTSGAESLTGDEKCTCILPPFNVEYIFEGVTPRPDGCKNAILKLSEIKRSGMVIVTSK